VTKLAALETFMVFSNTSGQRPWDDYAWPLVNWCLSVLLYLGIRFVQSLLMFFLADFGVVRNVDKEVYSQKFLKKEIQQLTLKIIGLSSIIKSFTEECTRFEKDNNKLTTHNRNLYREYETSIRTLEFLNTTIRVHLMKKSRNDFEQWSAVLESETRRANKEEEDRRRQVVS